MQDFVLFYSDSIAHNALARKHIFSQLYSLGIYSQFTLSLCSRDSLLNSLVWAYEAPWRRCIAFCDEKTFSNLNSALATTLDLELSLSHNEPAISSAKWLNDECIYFEHEKREYFISKNHANLSDELANLLAPKSASTAWLLGADAASAQILLSPAAESNYLNFSVSEISSGICAISLHTNQYSDADGFFDACSALFGKRFVPFSDLFAALVKELSARNFRIASAESCSGGLFSAKISAIAGASKVFVGAFCAYAKAAKRTWLNISHTENAAIYSQVCAQELAAAAMSKANANLGVGITGVLGKEPDEGVAPGVVNICVLERSGKMLCETLNLCGERAFMQELSAICAAALCHRLINDC